MMKSVRVLFCLGSDKINCVLKCPRRWHDQSNLSLNITYNNLSLVLRDLFIVVGTSDIQQKNMKWRSSISLFSSLSSSLKFLLYHSRKETEEVSNSLLLLKFITFILCSITIGISSFIYFIRSKEPILVSYSLHEMRSVKICCLSIGNVWILYNWIESR